MYTEVYYDHKKTWLLSPTIKIHLQAAKVNILGEKNLWKNCDQELFWMVTLSNCLESVIFYWCKKTTILKEKEEEATLTVQVSVQGQ